MLIEIKHNISGVILFSHDEEYNSVKKTLMLAVKNGTNLRDSDLRGSDLSGSNFRGSDLRDSDLRGSDLSGSDLSGSDLRGTNFSGSDLSDSDLRGSNFRGSDLSGSNFRGSDLRGSNLSGAYLRGACITGTNLTGAKNIQDSNEILSEIAICFNPELKPVASMIRGRIIGCWEEYTKTIREIFGKKTIKMLAEAWLQDEAWGVRQRLVEHGWI